MPLNYRIPLLISFLHLIIAKHSHVVAYNHDNIISIASVLGTRLIFNTKEINEQTSGKNLEVILWYKGIIDLEPLISSSVPLISSTNLSIDSSIPNQSRYHIINRTKLTIEQTLIGDEGFYTLKIQTRSNIYERYLYHVCSYRFLTFI